MPLEKPNAELDVPDTCSRIDIKIEGTDPSGVTELVMRESLKLLLKGEVNTERRIRRDFEDGIFIINRDFETPLTDDQKGMLSKMAGLEGVTVQFSSF